MEAPANPGQLLVDSSRLELSHPANLCWDQRPFSGKDAYFTAHTAKDTLQWKKKCPQQLWYCCFLEINCCVVHRLLSSYRSACRRNIISISGLLQFSVLPAGIDYFYHSNAVIFNGTHLKASTACLYFSWKGTVLILM